MESFPHHFEDTVEVSAPVETVFARLDDQRHLSAHMSKSSWMMIGSRMDLELDEADGRAVGSKIGLRGRVLGIPLSVDEIVTVRTPPTLKIWETIGDPNLLVIGRYRMGFEITLRGGSTMLRVFIDYAPPNAAGFRWLSKVFGVLYAKWCTTRMTRDAAWHFSLDRGSRS